MKPQIIAAILLLPIGLSLQAQISTSAAETLSQQINVMVSDHTDTVVVPTDSNAAVIIISTKILSNKQILDLWMFVSGSVIGKYLNENPALRTNEIWFTDAVGIKSNPPTFYSLPADVAKSVQARIHGGEIELEGGMSIISQSLSKTPK